MRCWNQSSNWQGVSVVCPVVVWLCWFFLLHPVVLCTGCRILGQVAEAVQYIISDSELTQSVQRNSAVYNIKCTGYIKQDEDCSPMSVNCHEQIVLCFEQGCVWCFCLYAHCKTSWDPLWIKSWFNLITTTRSITFDKRRGWRQLRRFLHSLDGSSNTGGSPKCFTLPHVLWSGHMTKHQRMAQVGTW